MPTTNWLFVSVLSQIKCLHYYNLSVCKLCLDACSSSLPILDIDWFVVHSLHAALSSCSMLYSYTGTYTHTCTYYHILLHTIWKHSSIGIFTLTFQNISGCNYCLVVVLLIPVYLHFNIAPFQNTGHDALVCGIWKWPSLLWCQSQGIYLYYINT